VCTAKYNSKNVFGYNITGPAYFVFDTCLVLHGTLDNAATSATCLPNYLPAALPK
jgi:hypothetical protein